VDHRVSAWWKTTSQKKNNAHSGEAWHSGMITAKPSQILSQKKTMLTVEKPDIQAWLQLSPHKYLCQLSQERGVPIVGSAFTATKFTCICTKLRVVQELRPTDPPAKIQFCKWMLKNVHDGLTDSQLLFITDEAYFQLNGYVNSQNTWICSDKNPCAFH
jgi:hypothetical protein